MAEWRESEKCKMSSEPRVLVSPVSKKQSTLSRFFTPKNDSSRTRAKRTSECIANEDITPNTKRTKRTRDLAESTQNKLSQFKNGYKKNRDKRPTEVNNGEETPKRSAALNASHFENSRKLEESPGTNSSEKKLGRAINLTPLEKQFLEIKKKYPDAILFVECGYRFRFFGDDAEVAASILNIMCTQDHNFKAASVPVQRLHIHVKRLVDAGHKVGVVRQTETAAIKAAGENKSAPFTRELTSLYTRSTLVEDDFGNNIEGVTGTNNNANYLMTIFEDPYSNATNDEPPGNADVSLAIVAVQPSAGAIVYDVFQDSFSRQELETRLEHVNPVDLLVPDFLSERSRKCIEDWKNIRGTAKVRVEEVPSDKVLAFEDALSTLTRFYGSKSDTEDAMDCESNSEENSDSHLNGSRGLLSLNLMDYPKSLVVCLSVVLEYLKQFKLESVLKATRNFKSFFKAESHMKLPGSTIRNLEIFYNQTDNTRRGTLFWVLDHTCTGFGKRKLNEWISHPLTEISEIERRQEAVAELVESKPSCLEKIRQLLSQLPDLEKGLCVIHHRKCSTAQFFNILVSLCKVHSEIASVEEAASKDIKSNLLRHILKVISTSLSDVSVYLDSIDEKAAKNCQRTNLFKDESQFPEIKKWREKIQEKQEEMQNHLKEIGTALRKPSVDYVTVAGNEFLVEVSESKLKSVPHNWIKISSTKTVSRFRTPFVEECFKKLCEYREHLKNACQEAWLNFLSSFGANYSRYCEAVTQLASLDCLMSLAEVAEQQGYTRPRISDKTSHIRIKQGKHPVVDALLNGEGQYVPNDTKLESDAERCMIITGPNMGGKSSYVRQVALICIMAQVGSFAPAEEAELGIIDAVYTRMGGNDDIYKGRSTFMNELQETSDILKHATPRSLVILDELGRGTSTHDGTAIAYATLSYFITNVTSLTLFITHYPSLASLEQSFPSRVSNYHMAFIAEGQDCCADTGTEDSSNSQTSETVITFLYKLVRGVAENSYGLNVARLAEIPVEILQCATQKSNKLKNIINTRRIERRALSTIWNCSSNDIRESIRKLDAELKAGCLNIAS